MISQQAGMSQVGQSQEAMNKIVLAGTRLMYDPKTFDIFKAGITKPGPLDDVLATQAAGLIKMLDDRAQGKLPRAAIAPAATMLLIEMARFMTQAGLADPQEADIKSAIEKLMKIILRLYPPGKQAATPATQPAAPMPAQAAPQPQRPAPSGIMGA